MTSSSRPEFVDVHVHVARLRLMDHVHVQVQDDDHDHDHDYDYTLDYADYDGQLQCCAGRQSQLAGDEHEVAGIQVSGARA